MTEMDLWPHVVQTHHDCRSVGTQLLVAGRLYDIDVAYGPDRPEHCTARHPFGADKVVCALRAGHDDGPHIAASKDYVERMQFTITGLRTSRSAADERSA